MSYYFLLLAFLLGTVVGSFLNVIIYRYNTGMTIGGRSMCNVCGMSLKWYELVPVVSFVVLRGRCRTCKTCISPQYVLVEILTGILFVGVAWKHLHLGLTGLSVFSFAYWGIIMSLLVVISVYDARHKIIPDLLVYTLTIVSLFALFFDFGKLVFEMPSFYHILSALFLSIPFAFLWFVSRGRWMGLGDAKLVLSFGWLLGLVGGISAIIFGFWIGAAYGIAILVAQKIVNKVSLESRTARLTMKSEVPFGPFLIIGLLIVYFFNINVFSLTFAF